MKRLRFRLTPRHVLLFVLLGALVSIRWPALVGARWSPTHFGTVRRMLEAGKVSAADTLFDLGSGDGRIPIAAARRFGARGVGLELDPFRLAWSRILARLFGVADLVRFEHANVFRRDLSEATVVTSFLTTDTHVKLTDKLLRELRPGTLVVTNTHRVPGLPIVEEDARARVYVYRIPE